MDKQTKFEDELKFYFPQIYKLHLLGKSDTNLWVLVDLIIQMREESATGNIRINYSKGHIDGLHKQTDVLAHKNK